MKPSSKTLAMLCVGLVAWSVPLFASASLKITQIMYDPPGSNVGHQWMQITNTGVAPENIAGYKLFQNGSNHGISVAVGTTTLPAGAVAIIANNPQTFLGDYPSYQGALFKAAFSLRASGDSVALKDAKLQLVDLAAYSQSSGAAGDGNALYITSAGLIPGRPDPGSYHATAPTAIVADVPVVAPAATGKSAGKTAVKSSGTFAAKSSHGTKSVASAMDANLAAVGASGGSSPSLLEIVAGSAAFGIVVVAGLLLQRRLTPESIPVSEPRESSHESTSESTTEAREYDIVESSGGFFE